MTYEYKCPKCKAAFDKNVPIADRDTVKCEKCKVKAKRQLPNLGITYSGSGWTKGGS